MTKGSFSSLIDIFEDKTMSEYGARLDDVVIFKIKKDELIRYLNTASDDVYLGYNTNHLRYDLKPIKMGNLSIGIHADQSKVSSPLSEYHSARLSNDINNLRTVIRDQSWLEKK